MYDRQRVARGAGAAIAVWTLIGLVFLSSGVAYAVPLAGLGGFNATIGVVEADSLALYPAVGDTAERNAYPQAIVELQNTELKDLEAYKDLDVSSFPGVSGTARFRLASRGDIDSNNVLLKTAALSADDTQFDGFRIEDRGTGDVRTSFEIFADERARLESVKIRAHYLTANSVDLSDLSLAVCYDSNNDGRWEGGPCDGESTFVSNNDAPYASGSATPQNAEPGMSVNFDASGSSDIDGAISSYRWDFGDGTTARGQAVSHAYSSAGKYTATLTVVDNEGAKSSDIVTVDVDAAAGEASAAASANQTTANPGELVVFDGLASSASGGFIESYDWDFGDGSSAAGDIVEHEFGSPGTYTVTLTTTSDTGKTATDSVDVTIEPNEAPTADVSANRTTQKVEEPISFDASGSSDPDGRITDYTWDLGDGTTATGPTVEHAYGSAGTYEVSLTLTDDKGKSATETVAIAVDTNDAPSVTADATPTAADPGETVSFDGSASDPDGTVESYEWDFGDGSTATGATPSHAYSSTGTYTATLTVTDSYGTTASDSVTVDVSQNTSPSVSLSANRTEAAPGDPISFSGSATDSDGSITGYEWALGDGTTATGTSTTHSYGSTGTYTVELTATDDDGATGSGTLQVDVVDGDTTSSSSGPGTARLAAGGTDELVLGEQLESSNGDYRLVLQSSDGNLVLRNASTGNAQWASNTAGDGGTNLTLQDDGNLVSYTDSGTSVWASDTAGSGADELVLEDDGSLVLYASGSEVWSVNG